MFYIIENNIKEDGTVNTSTVARSNFASACNYFYERVSKMSATDLFPKTAIMLTDKYLNVKEYKLIDRAEIDATVVE